MIDQLKVLEKTVLDVRKHYHITATELVNLKTKMEDFDSDANAKLKQQLIRKQSQLDAIESQLNELTGRHKEMSSNHQTLVNEHNEATQKVEQLEQQVKQLQQDKAELIEKNRIAAEHTKGALERLTQIDNT